MHVPAAEPASQLVRQSAHGSHGARNAALALRRRLAPARVRQVRQQHQALKASAGLRGVTLVQPPLAPRRQRVPRLEHRGRRELSPVDTLLPQRLVHGRTQPHRRRALVAALELDPAPRLEQRNPCRSRAQLACAERR